MIKIIKITYEEFKKWRDSNYSKECLKRIFLNYIDRETINRIDDIDHNWGLRFTLYLKGERKWN